MALREEINETEEIAKSTREAVEESIKMSREAIKSAQRISKSARQYADETKKPPQEAINRADRAARAAVEMAKAMANMKLLQTARAYPSQDLKAKPEYW